MEKIKMTTPLVEMDGDEMTRILWKMIKDELLLPFIDLKTEDFSPCFIRQKTPHINLCGSYLLSTFTAPFQLPFSSAFLFLTML